MFVESNPVFVVVEGAICCGYRCNYPCCRHVSSIFQMLRFASSRTLLVHPESSVYVPAVLPETTNDLDSRSHHDPDLIRLAFQSTCETLLMSSGFLDREF